MLGLLGRPQGAVKVGSRTAAGGAVLEHVVRVILALVAVGRPVGAPRLYVAADVGADLCARSVGTS